MSDRWESTFGRERHGGKSREQKVTPAMYPVLMPDQYRDHAAQVESLVDLLHQDENELYPKVYSASVQYDVNEWRTWNHGWLEPDFESGNNEYFLVRNDEAPEGIQWRVVAREDEWTYELDGA